MKKFRTGDTIAMKSDPRYVYIVGEHNGKEWMGKAHPDHVHFTRAGCGTGGCHLGKDPKHWRVVERAASKKDERIKVLEAQLEARDGAAKEALEQAADQKQKNDMVLLDRDLAMLEAGYVSLERLRRNTMAPMDVIMYGGVRHTEVQMRLRKPVNGSDSVYLGAFLDAMKGN